MSLLTTEEYKAIAAGCSDIVKPAKETPLTTLPFAEGGKNRAVMLDDAENLDCVAAHIVNGAFWTMGENCPASPRLIVQKGVREALLKPIVACAREWPMGDPTGPANRVGAPVSTAHCEKVCGYLEKGPKLIPGGKADKGVVEPAILEAARGATQASSRRFSPRTASARSAAPGAGTITVNSFGKGDISTPFGGFRQSGFGGRDNGIHARVQYARIKTIWVDRADDADKAVN